MMLGTPAAQTFETEEAEKELREAMEIARIR